MPVQRAYTPTIVSTLRLVGLLTGLLCTGALAAGALPVPDTGPASAAAVTPQRPRIGLVLSGGGARGAAHIGVLKVLEEQRIPIDAIAGTSMGAIVGGLYASGMSATEVEQLLRSVNWQNAFRDRPARADLDSRRKQDDREFLVRLPLGLRGGKFQLPRGLVHGQKLLLTLRRATLPVADIEQFDQLPIPFRAVATDIATGDAVVLREGQLASALRASMSAPGVFAPVELDGRLLVDGGIADNLPVEVARAMGVDILIAVDVSFPLYAKNELRSALQISNQTLAILIGREAARQRALLGASDILISPPLGGMGSTEFTKVQEAIAAGEQAARALAPRLAALSVSPADYAAFQARHSDYTPTPARIEFVRVDEESGRYKKLVAAAMAPAIGETVDSPKVDQALRTLYGKDLFETLDYRVVRQDDEAGLEIAARRKSWGPNFVRFGLELQDNFEGDNSFNAGARFLVTDVNPYAAEWVTDLQVGGSPRLAMEFFQPLGYASPWFVAPRVRLESRNVLVPGDEGQRAEYRVREASYGVDFGRMFSNCCEVRVGVQRTQGSSHLRIGEPGPDTPISEDFDFGQYFFRFSFDKLDSVFFPRHGELLTFEWNGTREMLGSARDNDRMEFNWLVARSLGRNTLIASLAGGTTLGGQPAVQDLFALGGFLNLSGVTRDSLTGPHYGIARVVYLRKVGSGGEGFLNVPMYAGLSFEAGNVWAERHEMSFGSTRKDGAIFLGLDTLLGPVYLGAGFDEAGGSAYYLFLGRTF